jgi:aqualysin 1
LSRYALNGFAAVVPAATLDLLRADPRVVSVERDGVMHVDTTQQNATWGIDRIGQASLPLSGTYTYTATGARVTAYVIDTGIRKTHSEFGGRAVAGADTSLPTGVTTDDCHGHGTHVAGTIGGATYGVAKAVIAGVDWVTGNHQAGQPAVANMSLGGADACGGSPADVGAAITVGATENTDARASYSNFGPCVDFFAPGSNIVSASFLTDTGTATMSGTSIATPHVVGAAALCLQRSPSASPQQARDGVFNLTTKHIVSDARSANDNLLFVNF